MEEQWSDLAKKHNISPAQQHILFLLSTNRNALTQTQISELGCWHISTVTRLLKPMKENGLISVHTDEKQSRYKRVKLTEHGRLLLEDLIRTVEDMDNFPLDMRHLYEKEIKCFFEIGESILDVHKGEDFKRMVIHAQMQDCDYA
jgi:DNA-binding MarR family transcriptional regulator